VLRERHTCRVFLAILKDTFRGNARVQATSCQPYGLRNRVAQSAVRRTTALDKSAHASDKRSKGIKDAAANLRNVVGFSHD